MYGCDIDEIESDMGKVVSEHGITTHAVIVLVILALRLLVMIARRMVRDGGDG